MDHRDETLKLDKEKYRQKHPLPPYRAVQEGYKLCCVCKEIKSATTEYFGINKNSKDGLRHACKECRHKEYLKNQSDCIQKNRKRYANKKEEILIKNKEYKETHKELYRQIGKEYYKNNMAKMKEKARINTYKRIQKDVGYRLLVRYRTRLYKALKGIIKPNHTLDLIGCSILELKAHLEKQFEAGMSWENYGKWHVDHILPCARFDFTKQEDQQKCFHYSNLQPLWAEDNLKKSAS